VYYGKIKEEIMIMIKKCLSCGSNLIKVNLITSRNTFYITQEPNPNLLTKSVNLKTYICKQCGQVNFFVEDLNFLDNLHQD